MAAALSRGTSRSLSADRGKPRPLGRRPGRLLEAIPISKADRPVLSPRGRSACLRAGHVLLCFFNPDEFRID